MILGTLVGHEVGINEGSDVSKEKSTDGSNEYPYDSEIEG